MCVCVCVCVCVRVHVQAVHGAQGNRGDERNNVWRNKKRDVSVHLGNRSVNHIEGWKQSVYVKIKEKAMFFFLNQTISTLPLCAIL